MSNQFLFFFSLVLCIHYFSLVLCDLCVHRYGFVMPDNPYDKLMLPMPYGEHPLLPPHNKQDAAAAYGKELILKYMDMQTFLLWGWPDRLGGASSGSSSASTSSSASASGSFFSFFRSSVDPSASASSRVVQWARVCALRAEDKEGWDRLHALLKAWVEQTSGSDEEEGRFEFNGPLSTGM